MPVGNITFNRAYFHGDHPAGYSDYGPGARGGGWTFERAYARILEHVEPHETALVLGAAYGYGVEALLDHGVEAFGLDISEWCVEQDATGRVLLGDALDPEVLAIAAANAGVEGFDLVVSEGLLSLLSDEEVVAGEALWRVYGEHVVHLTHLNLKPELEAFYANRTLEQVEALVDGSLVLDYHEAGIE